MPEDNINNELFKNEMEIIKASRDYIALTPEPEEFKERFIDLVQKYQKLLKLTKKIFRISDRHSVELKRREAEIKNLLDNSNQGFLTFGRNLIVNKEYSAECHNIFGQKIGGLLITEVLTNQNNQLKRHFITTLKKVYESLPSEEAHKYLEDLPTQIILDEKIIQIQFKIIENSMGYQQEPLIMLICTDISEKHQAEEQIRYLSYHDKLTSLYNRAYIDSVIQKFTEPEHLPFSVIMGDMNGLKLTNDVFGHKEGDRMLVSMAEVLKKCIREGDLAGRYGGDEFILLLPKTDEHVCQTIITRIQTVCRHLKWDPIELSISLGSATQGKGTQVDFREIYSAAENDMYTKKSLEKQTNKDRIIKSMETLLENQCCESKEHANRLYILTQCLVERVSLGRHDIDHNMIRLLSRLHDVGKVAIDKELLSKPEITPQETDLFKRHSEIGYRMAKAIGEEELAEVILCIHERWDGQGYPRGLTGTQIPILARILAIIHRYESLTHPQKKNRLSSQASLHLIMAEKGKAFDPELIEMFNKLVRECQVFKGELSI